MSNGTQEETQGFFLGMHWFNSNKSEVSQSERLLFTKQSLKENQNHFQ